MTLGPGRRRRATPLHCAIVAGLLASAGACDTPPTALLKAAHVDLGADWATADPSSQGVNATRLAAAASQARQYPGLRSLLVARHGELLGEYYFGNAGRDTLFDVRSVTKSVMSLLVGTAVADGHLTGPAETLPAALPSLSASLTPGQAAITLGSILTMSSGIRWVENGGVGYNDWISAPDQVGYLLAQPVIAAPGQLFAYNSAAVHLLSVMISDAYGRSTESFARDRLFTPLGMAPDRWETVSQGYNNGAAGLAIRARDVAKIGQLVLQDGFSGSRQIVPKSWIDESTRSHINPYYELGTPANVRYGYLWWLGTAGGHDIVMAWGYGGQYLIIVRDLDLVMVATTNWLLDGPNAALQAIAVRDFLLTSVMGAVMP
jgi:CubicO group peptidase (beta-lactamase class C family)